MPRLYSSYALNKSPAYRLCMTIRQAKRQHYRARSQYFNAANGVFHKPRYSDMQAYVC